MAYVKDNQTPLQKNMSDVLYIYSFAQLMSMGAGLFIAFTSPEMSVCIVPAAVIVALFLLRLGGTLPLVYSVQSVFIIFLELVYYRSPQNKLVHTKLCVAFLLIIVSTLASLSIAGVLYWFTKQFPGRTDFGWFSAGTKMATLQILTVFFCNGYTMLSFWCLKQRGHRGLKIVGLALVSFAGFLSFCCCMSVLMCWRGERRRQRVQVSAATS